VAAVDGGRHKASAVPQGAFTVGQHGNCVQ